MKNDLKLVKVLSSEQIVNNFNNLLEGRIKDNNGYELGCIDDSGEFYDTNDPGFIELIEKIGLWGFMDVRDSTIYYWISEHSECNFELMLSFFAHEIGHSVPKAYKTVVREEQRANTYAKVASLAYKFANIAYSDHTKTS